MSFGCVPFIFSQAGIVIRVNDSEFALRKRDFAECVAEAYSAIQQDEKNDELYQPVWNVDGNLDDPTPSW